MRQCVNKRSRSFLEHCLASGDRTWALQTAGNKRAPSHIAASAGRASPVLQPVLGRRLNDRSFTKHAGVCVRCSRRAPMSERRSVHTGPFSGRRATKKKFRKTNQGSTGQLGFAHRPPLCESRGLTRSRKLRVVHRPKNLFRDLASERLVHR